MAITTEWNIAQLERQLNDGVVYSIHYTVESFDGTYRSSAYGSLGVEPPEPDSLIPFSDLTKEIVVGWVKDKFGDEKVAEIEAALAEQISQQRTPTNGTGVPWAN